LSFINSEILFDNNPFLDGLPIEISSSNDLSYIVYYFEGLRGRDNRGKLFETKLLLVGKGNVGKTTLMKVFQNNKFKVEVGKEKTTHGINVQSVKRDVFFPAKMPYYDRFLDMENIYFLEVYSDIEID